MKHDVKKKTNSGNNNKISGKVFPGKTFYAIFVLLMGLAAMAFLVALIVVDAFPADLTYLIIGVAFLLLIAASVMMARKKRWKRVIGILIGVIFLFVIGSVTYYLGATYAMMNKISEYSENSGSTDSSSDVDVTAQPFNIYVSGIDRWAGEDDLDRSDVNMIITVHPITKKVMLTSIPRDAYVKLHTAQAMDKLTHSGVYGVDETLNTVEDWLGVDLNYYVKLNFSAMRGIINAIGGIDVYSPVAFDSDISDCSYQKGWNHLNGREALYFARERHAFEGQDAERVENQQRVVKAIIKKMTSSTDVLSNYGEIMKVAGTNMETNMGYNKIQSLIKMQMSDLATWNIDTQKMEGEYGMNYVASLSSKRQYSVYYVEQESIDKCLEGMDAIMNPTEEELQEAIEKTEQGFINNVIKKAREKAEAFGKEDKKD